MLKYSTLFISLFIYLFIFLLDDSTSSVNATETIRLDPRLIFSFARLEKSCCAWKLLVAINSVINNFSAFKPHGVFSRAALLVLPSFFLKLLQFYPLAT